jgi:putative sterol carrier protein
MPNEAISIVQAFVARRFDERLSDVRTVCALEFTDDGERIVVALDRGALSIAPPDTRADCVIASSIEDFLDVFRHRKSLVTSIMRGRIVVTGDLTVALLIQGLLPSPQDLPFAPDRHP